MSNRKLAVAILLAAFFMAEPASVSGKLMSLPYSVFGTYKVVGTAGDSHFVPGQQSFDLEDFAPEVSADVVGYDSGDLSAGVGPFIAGGAKSSNVGASIQVHGQLGSFKIFTSANAFSQRITNDCPYCAVNANAQSEGTLDVADWVEFSSKTASSMIVNTKWTISFSPGSPGDMYALAYGATHQSGTQNSDYTTSMAASFINVTGTGIAPGPYPAVGAGGLQAPSRAYAVYWNADGGYDPPITVNQVQQNPPASVPISFKINAGVPLHVSWTFDVGSGASVTNEDLTPGFGEASSYADFTHTANWGGITSVIDADTGLPVTDWTMDSASGFDYVHPFAEPEPASIVLAVIGAIGGLAIARRQSTALNRA
jgi:hypothetical protein